MKRFLIPTVIAAVVLAACGSDGSGDSSSNSTTAGARSATVSVASVDGAGDVLVDASGKTLYTADVESDGTIHCVGACESFWDPLAAGASSPTAAEGVPSLGVIPRPDGTMQVAVNGQPLYTFTQDSAGTVSGDGFADDFGGQHFVWHVVHSDGSVGAVPSQPTPTIPGGYEGYGGAGY